VPVREFTFETALESQTGMMGQVLPSPTRLRLAV
jgi:hypothetical protein